MYKKYTFKLTTNGKTPLWQVTFLGYGELVANLYFISYSLIFIFSYNQLYALLTVMFRDRVGGGNLI